MEEFDSSQQPTLIAAALRRRVGWLVLAHLPALLFALSSWWLALGWLLILHAIVLWGTLNPQSALFGPVLRSVPGTERIVWITIDDGPSSDTLAILQLLREHDAKATFFLVADRAQRQTELVRAIIAAGHEVGNHSATHPAGRFWSLSPARMAREIAIAQRTLTQLSGTPVRWFRAVVGHANPFVEPVLRALELRRVSWSARAFDAVDGNAMRVTTRLFRAIRPGSIVLLHEGAAHGQNVMILQCFLTGLRERGYRAVLPPSGNATNYASQ
jgi:peptidoglycan/xylan/chitin deacetylase (PgdA/CDA1 family)